MKAKLPTPERANQLALYYMIISIALAIAGNYINNLVDATTTDIPFLTGLIILGCFVIWLVKVSQDYAPEALGFRNFSWSSTFWLFFWLIIVGEGITAFVLTWFPRPMVEVLLKAFTPETLLSWFLFLFMATLIAPVGEEIVFRGFILNSYARSIGAHRAVWISAILFGLAHHSPPHVLAAFFSGLVFARFVMAGGSLWSSIIAHALVNFSSTVMMHFNQSPLAFPEQETTLAGGILGLGIAIIATAMFFHYHPVSRKQTPEPPRTIINTSLIVYLAITLSLAALNLFSTLSQPSVVIPAQ